MKNFLINKEDEDQNVHILARVSVERPELKGETEGVVRANAKIFGALMKSEPSINGSSCSMLINFDMRGDMLPMMIAPMAQGMPAKMHGKLKEFLSKTI